MLCLLSLLQEQFLSPTFADRSIYLLSGAVSMKDMLFIDDFILIAAIQWSYYMSSMQYGCLHGLYKVV